MDKYLEFYGISGNFSFRFNLSNIVYISQLNIAAVRVSYIDGSYIDIIHDDLPSEDDKTMAVWIKNKIDSLLKLSNVKVVTRIDYRTPPYNIVGKTYDDGFTLVSSAVVNSEGRGEYSVTMTSGGDITDLAQSIYIEVSMNSDYSSPVHTQTISYTPSDFNGINTVIASDSFNPDTGVGYIRARNVYNYGVSDWYETQYTSFI